MSVETLQHSNGGSKVLGFSGSKRLRQGWMSRHDEATDRLLGPPDTGSANCLGGGGGAIGILGFWAFVVCPADGRWFIAGLQFMGGRAGGILYPKTERKRLHSAYRHSHMSRLPF